ncbi:RluA family pseudouridine synthase [Candidatus Saccharibacteria bacterium]|nr:RluA family pseudouridine synthase [Candidatus Saccharibacteria bacterium]
MIITGKKFSKPEMSRVINGDIELKEDEKAIPKMRLDLMMVGIYKSYNRSTLQKFIESGFVTVDGVLVTKPNQKFPEGVKIELNVPETLKNADLKPKVIYEDENVLVLDKPAGLLSEAKGEYCPERTLEDFGYIAHRLDRDTSGVVILAKNEEVQKFLKKQFQDRKVHKVYNAIVEGRLKLDEARIDLPLARDLKRPTTFRVDPNGKEAETFYKVLKTNDKYSLVELRPTTGRTHQLRVHMKYLGHPILGDPVYGSQAKLSEDKKYEFRTLPAVKVKDASGLESEIRRLFLHAKELEIILPGGKRMTFKADLPKEFSDVL